MDYSKMSDLEINKAVGDIAMNGTWHMTPSHPGNTTGGWLYGSNGIETRPLPDYCNSWADAGPIIQKNSISLISDWNEEGIWGATFQPWIYSEHENPLRAAMECYLMMHDKGEE